MKKFLGLNSIEVLWKHLREYIGKEYLHKTELDNIYNKSEIDSKIESLETTEVDLTNYYTKPEINSLITNSQNSKVTLVTYSDLYDLVEGSRLIPGQWYVITDYNATVNYDNYIDKVSVSQNPINFDIWVMATHNNVLLERGFITVDNEFFADVHYSIYNDTERFDWADTKRGKGVIYRMIDKFNNDCPYDFLNICFKINQVVPVGVSVNIYNHTFCKHVMNSDYSVPAIDARIMNNKVESMYSGSKLTLPTNIIYTSSTSRNIFNSNIRINGTGNFIGSLCDNISIYGSNNSIPGSSKNITIRNNSSGLKLTSTGLSGVQNVDIINGIGEITLDPNTEYTTTVAKNSDGETKVFVLADIIE